MKHERRELCKQVGLRGRQVGTKTVHSAATQHPFLGGGAAQKCAKANPPPAHQSPILLSCTVLKGRRVVTSLSPDLCWAWRPPAKAAAMSVPAVPKPVEKRGMGLGRTSCGEPGGVGPRPCGVPGGVGTWAAQSIRISARLGIFEYSQQSRRQRSLCGRVLTEGLLDRQGSHGSGSSGLHSLQRRPPGQKRPRNTRAQQTQQQTTAQQTRQQPTITKSFGRKSWRERRDSEQPKPVCQAVVGLGYLSPPSPPRTWSGAAAPAAPPR